MTRCTASDFHFLATGIGSVPDLDARAACLRILEACPHIPFWPQLVHRSPLEDMVVQFTEGLPFLEITGDRKALLRVPGHTEQELLAFYDRFLAEDVDHFALSKTYAPGLHEMLDLLEGNPEKYGPFVKGHTVGPVTFAAAIRDDDGRNLFAYPDLSEAFVKALAIRALWQVRQLGRSGKRPILFLDEPYLAGYGSAFTPIQRHEVVALIKEVVDYLRERSEAIIGIHCCGNTDWSMIVEAGPDILSFDAFSYLDYFFLYAGELRPPSGSQAGRPSKACPDASKRPSQNFMLWASIPPGWPGSRCSRPHAVRELWSRPPPSGFLLFWEGFRRSGFRTSDGMRSPRPGHGPWLASYAFRGFEKNDPSRPAGKEDISSRLDGTDFKLAHIVHTPVRVHVTEIIAGLVEDISIRVHFPDKDAAHIVDAAVGINMAHFAPVGSGHNSIFIHRAHRRAIGIQDIALRSALLGLGESVRARKSGRAKQRQHRHQEEYAKCLLWAHFRKGGTLSGFARALGRSSVRPFSKHKDQTSRSETQQSHSPTTTTRPASAINQSFFSTWTFLRSGLVSVARKPLNPQGCSQS
jgi:hypothetical protein